MIKLFASITGPRATLQGQCASFASSWFLRVRQFTLSECEGGPLREWCPRAFYGFFYRQRNNLSLTQQLSQFRNAYLFLISSWPPSYPASMLCFKRPPCPPLERPELNRSLGRTLEMAMIRLGLPWGVQMSISYAVDSGTKLCVTRRCSSHPQLLGSSRDNERILTVNRRDSQGMSSI